MPHKLTRDERAALNLRLPFPVSNIISSSMEEFGEMLNTWYCSHWGVVYNANISCGRPLTEQQINLCRDIRRRGKNKVTFFAQIISFPFSPHLKMSKNSLPTFLLSVFSDRRPKLPPAEDGADNGAGRGGERFLLFFTNSLCPKLSMYKPKYIPQQFFFRWPQ